MAFDKKLHFAAGLLIAISVGFLFVPGYGFAAAVFAGLMKELRDWGCYKGFDWKDMVVTWQGGFVGFIVTMLLRLGGNT